MAEYMTTNLQLHLSAANVGNTSDFLAVDLLEWTALHQGRL